MAYVDPNFQVTFDDTIVGGGAAIGVTLGTVTTNGTATYTGTAGTAVNGTLRFPIFKAPIQIKGLRVYTTNVAGAGVTGLVATFLNGTTVFGTATLSTTVGFVDAAITALTLDSHGSASGGALFTGTSSNEMLMNLVAIGTASGSALGSYSIDLIWNNLFTV